MDCAVREIGESRLRQSRFVEFDIAKDIEKTDKCEHMNS
jgi:hypothetical protein